MPYWPFSWRRLFLIDEPFLKIGFKRGKGVLRPAYNWKVRYQRALKWNQIQMSSVSILSCRVGKCLDKKLKVREDKVFSMKIEMDKVLNWKRCKLEIGGRKRHFLGSVVDEF